MIKVENYSTSPSNQLVYTMVVTHHKLDSGRKVISSEIKSIKNFIGRDDEDVFGLVCGEVTKLYCEAVGITPTFALRDDFEKQFGSLGDDIFWSIHTSKVQMDIQIHCQCGDLKNDDDIYEDFT